jgi:hypothetical protein
MSSEIAICDSAHSENVFVDARSSNQKHQFDVIFLESVKLVRFALLRYFKEQSKSTEAESCTQHL